MSEGGRRAGRRGGRAIRMAALAAAILIALRFGLPRDTGAGSIAARAAVGLAVGVVVVLAVRRALGSLVEAPPPPPPALDARGTEVVYACGVCGTRVRLEVATTGKPPRHCGEEMEPELAAGR